MTQSMLVTRQSLKLDFFIPGAAWQGLWDRLEVWRSQTTADGPYVPLHADTWRPATLPLGSPIVAPSPPQTGAFVTIVGKDLHFLIDEKTPVDITFTGTDPLTLAQVATQIAAQSNQLLSSYVISGQVVVQTTQIGEIATLRCAGGEAAALLGFDTTSAAFGADSRIQLTVGKEQYSVLDANGAPQFFYKTRFYNSASSLFSDYSLPSQAVTIVGVSAANLVRCYVDLVGSMGAALGGQEILIGLVFTGAIVEGKALVGGNTVLLTDVNGHAEMLIPRGQKITMAIGGTDLVRDITVPTDPNITSLNLLDPSVGTNDLFTVQKQLINYAVRRSI
jgi:hypothetical protein